MATSSDISSAIANSLYLSDPELDTSIGTPLRKIIDAVSNQIALNTVDSYLINYQYDIDTKSGGDLDDFCANFGLARKSGSLATGTLTFARSTDIAATTAATIPAGTQVATGNVPQQVFQTTVATTMAIGVTSVNIPAQAVQQGPDSNISAASPLSLINTVVGISTVSNPSAFLGGTIDETDDQLRSRFKQTVFRNLAGTESMYSGIALQSIANQYGGSYGVARATVIGSSEHNVEQLQITSTSITSQLTTAAYIYGASVYITDSTGAVLNPNTDYTFSINNAASPATITVTIVNTAGYPNGGFLQLEYDYCSTASRNDPLNTRWGQGIVNNRVDIWVNGQIASNATQNVWYQASHQFTNTPTDSLYTVNFINLYGTHPATGNVFTPLAFGPMISIGTPDSSGNGTLTLPSYNSSTSTHANRTYVEHLDFNLVYQNTAFGYAPGSLYGISWRTSTAGTQFAAGWTPDPSVPLTINYVYNSIPYQVTDDLSNWRLMGTDVMVHAGKPIYLRFNLAVVYSQGSSQSSVNTAIKSTLTTYLMGLGFSAGIQVSDLISMIHGVPGVDNVRFLNSGDDATNYAIQSVQLDGTVINTYHSASGFARDVYYDENQYPLIATVSPVRIVVKGRNTF